MFWLVFLLLFFGISSKKFQLFSITTEISSNNIPLLNAMVDKGGTSLIFWIFYYFKESSSNLGIFFISLFLLLFLIVSLFILTFMILKLFKTINLKLIFKKITSIADNIFNIKQNYIILFLFLISFIIRLIYLDSGLLHHDSVEYAIATENTLETGKLQSVVGERYALILINSIVYLIPHFIFDAQSSELTLNITTILFASLSVILLYLFIQEFLNNRYISFSSALLFSLNPIFLSTTTYAKDHAPSIFFILLVGYSLLRILKYDTSLYKILFGFSIGILLFIRSSDIIVILPFFLIYVFPHLFLKREDIVFNKKYEFKNLLLLLFPLALFLIIYFVLQYPFSLGYSDKFVNPIPDLVDIFLIIMVSSTTLGVFLVVYGTFYYLKKKKYLVLLFLIWSFLILIFYSSFFSTKLRFFVPIVIPISILMAIGLNEIKQRFGIVSHVLLIITVSLMLMFSHQALAFRHNYSSGKEVAIYIDDVTEENALIFDWGDDSIFYDYYIKRSVIGCPYIGKEKEFNDKINMINRALDNNIPVYLVDRCFLYGRAEELQETIRILNENYDFKQIGEVQSENYEDIIVLRIAEFKIYKLRKKQ